MKKRKKLLIFIIVNILLLLMIYIGIYFYAWICPKLAINSAKSYYLYDSEENLITGNDEWISYEEIDKDVINATISIEDKNFFKHSGFDFLRIGKAVINNIKSGSSNEGASTITQQYAKNLFLDFGKSLKRKINEAWLTVRIETHYTKEEILEGYLNTINYGGIFGIENASKYYFGKSAKDLKLSEAAMLAGIPNYPSEYSPFSNYEASKKRQLTVLNAMLRNNKITQEQLDEAYNEELVFVKSEENDIVNLWIFVYND